MKRKFFASFLAAAAIAVVSGLGHGTSARAEMVKVYDYASMTWKKVDASKRKYTRKNPPKKYERRMVVLNSREKPGTIIVHTDQKFLYLVLGNNRAIRYGVGVGREGFTWSANNLTIQRKKEWPDWTPPPEMVAREAAQGHKVGFMKGGEDNPLGARALYLYKNGRDTQYRIHGTNQPWSIGLNLSSGCIRMMNKDITDLYSRVPVGTKVVVIGEGEDPAKYFGPSYNPMAYMPKFGVKKSFTNPVATKSSVDTKSTGSVKKQANAAPQQTRRPTMMENVRHWQNYWKKRWTGQTAAQ